MTGADRRRQLRAQYEARRPEAGVYLLRNTTTGRILVASAVDLRGARNRLAFGQETNSTGVLDRRLVADAREFGMAAFAFEVLDVLPMRLEMTPDEVQRDLRALEDLWREKLAGTPQY